MSTRAGNAGGAVQNPGVPFAWSAISLPKKIELKIMRNEPVGWPRQLGLNANNTTCPLPCFTSSAAAKPCRNLSPPGVMNPDRSGESSDGIFREHCSDEAVGRRERRRLIHGDVGAIRHSGHHRMRGIDRHLHDRRPGEILFSRESGRRVLHRQLQRLSDARRAVAPREHGAAALDEFVDRARCVVRPGGAGSSATSTASTAAATAATATTTPKATESVGQDQDVEARREVSGLKIGIRHLRVLHVVRVEQPLGPSVVTESDARWRTGDGRA